MIQSLFYIIKKTSKTLDTIELLVQKNLLKKITINILRY